jgi:hypothetical protein
VIRKIRCIWHKEDTASLTVYPDGKIYCFGCRKAGTAKDLGEELPVGEAYVKPKEDIRQKIAYINELPKRAIRGFNLPVDNLFYYLVWPDSNYYKARVIESSGSDKYRSPTGHRKPLYFPQQTDSDTLIIIEGEFNALSLANSSLPYNVCSPGPAGDFYSLLGQSYLTSYTKYKTILLIVDRDPAGVIGAINLKAALLKHTPNVTISLWDREQDANDIYQGTNGQQRLREKIEKDLGVSRRMSPQENTL